MELEHMLATYLRDLSVEPPPTPRSLFQFVDGLDADGLLRWRRHKPGSNNKKNGEFAEFSVEPHLQPLCRCNGKAAASPQYRLYRKRAGDGYHDYRLIHLRCGDTVPIVSRPRAR
jgi:hypothetical protein